MAHSNQNLVLGTAGHIDHGKSSLVKALTGTDPDRLAEEARRGITIELGFAQLNLPDGSSMGVVDVPGHERFVRQMIAGATGIDLALLVIAGDDGVMPQTEEHVAVLETLGVPRALVALTKIDLVDPEWVEFMAGEVEAYLETTSFAGAKIVPVSAKTGEGCEDLKASIAEACSGVRRAKPSTCARLPIDRVFTIKGAGTVVTGTLWSGEVRPGDELQILPSGERSRVRSVQSHGHAVDVAVEGNRVALNLADLSTDQVRPGDFACGDDHPSITDHFDVRFTYLDPAHTAKPLETGARMHVAHGTREVLGRVLFCEGVERLMPGETCLAQIRLEEPLAIVRGDRFVVRTYSPVAVAGGGIVLLSRPRRRTNLTDNESALLAAVREGDLRRAVPLDVALRAYPSSAPEIAVFLDCAPEEAARCAEEAIVAREIVGITAPDGTRFYAPKSMVAKITSAIQRELVRFHSENPNEAGIAKAALAQRIVPHASDSCFEALLAQAQAAGVAVVAAGIVGDPHSAGATQAALAEAADALFAELVREGITSQVMEYVARDAKLDLPVAKKAAAILEKDGRAERITTDWYVAKPAIDAARDAVRAHLQAGGDGAVAALKDVMGVSRKYAVPLVEHFDATGFTVREGDNRRLR